jgi:hypothetical protein
MVIRSHRIIALRCLAVLSIALIGCGSHNLDLYLALASDSCTVPVPAGGSILYQMTMSGPVNPTDGGASSCGACLAVPNALPDAKTILAFLRANVPPCPNVPPNSQIQVALTAWSVPSCPGGGASSRTFCSQSQSVTLPDGHGDAVVSVVLTCNPSCSSMCTPTTCKALGFNCGTVDNGCGVPLNCGTCTPPLKCGGGQDGQGQGTPNVCSSDGG